MVGQVPDVFTDDVLLRDVIASDLAIFFEQQLDESANYMAAFTASNPTDRDAFMARWSRTLCDETVMVKAILFRGQVAGQVLSYEDDELGHTEVGYWLGKEYWGQGIATRALAVFLKCVTVRPLYARVVNDNLASLRVLEKCGFMLAGKAKDFANARHAEVEEFILVLDNAEGKA
jgi:RimJ/RimL family protein N-acetyltransferase